MKADVDFSIITVSYNSAKTIAKTLDSVMNQSYGNYEHIVIDGGSIDGTVDILRSNLSKKLVYVSESDNGIYDAMNKGINLAKGKYIAILNSDDFFKDNNILRKLYEIFEIDRADIVYSGVEYINARQEVVSEWIPNPFKKGHYRKGFNTPHPGFFATRKLYAKLGLFDTTMPIAADFDLMYRFMENPGSKCLHWPAVTVVMRSDGTSSSIKNIIQGYHDIRRAFGNKNQVISFAPYIIQRYLPKLKRKLITLIFK